MICRNDMSIMTHKKKTISHPSNRTRPLSMCFKIFISRSIFASDFSQIVYEDGLL